MKKKIIFFSIAFFILNEFNAFCAEKNALENLGRNVAELPEMRPSFEWEEDSAENHGIRQSVIDSIIKEAESYKDIYALGIAKDSKIIGEWYKAGFDKNTKFEIHSCSKSITGCLVGIAADKGFIKGENQKFSDFLLDYDENSKKYVFLNGNPSWPKLELRHLLTMTSGVNMSDGDWDEWRASKSWLEWIYKRKALYRPGEVFSYGTQNTHLLSFALERATGQRLFDFAQKNLFSKIGIKDAYLGTDPEGIGDGGNGYLLTIQDMLRFGKLYLDDGMWQEKQIVSKEWVKKSLSLQVDRHGRGTANYGFQFWVRDFEGERVYFAWGWAGQFIFIIPSQNAAIAFASNHTGTLKPYFNAVTKIIQAGKK